jgi:DNA-binding NarL/FixJ family response regulator
MNAEPTGTRPLRILIADDHAFFRRGLRDVLEDDGNMSVVAEAADGEEAVAQAKKLYPRELDVVLMDLQMPRLDGLAATKRILAEMPGLPVIVLTASTDDRDLLGAAQAGAIGFLTKSYSPEAIVRALLDFHHSKALPMSRTMAAKVLDYFRQVVNDGDSPPAAQEGNTVVDSLTPREREVIELVEEGSTDREIANRLSIAERTVKVHLQSIFRKLDARNRTQAVTRYRAAKA